MITLIVSSIIGLLVIAGAAISTGKLMKLCEENDQQLKRLLEKTEEASRFMKDIEDKTDELVMEKLLLDAQEILNQKQS